MLANRTTTLSLTILVQLAAAMPLAAEEPLSAIDWLSQSVAASGSLPRGTVVAPPGGPVAAGGIPRPSDITVTPLNRKTPAALGLVKAARSGLPYDLWAGSKSADLARRLRAERPEAVPALRQLLATLLIAEFAPPADGDPGNALFLARIDKLLDIGALDPALSLLEQIEKPDAETFRRFFDVSLLVGEEDRACRVMGQSAQIAPTFPARVFCLARSGDWNAAALSLRTGTTLGTVDPEMADLLAHFLDPELFEGAPDLPPPDRPSPLVLRLMEAIGQPMSTATLPVAFAQADLRSNTGWKVRLEAGERLARLGAIPPNRLLGLYSEQAPAASGGVWERVSAVQEIEEALDTGDDAALAERLPGAWAEMRAQGLDVPFAKLFGARLSGRALEGEAGALAFRIGLLSDAYEHVALQRQSTDPAELFLIGIAKGEVAGLVAADPLPLAIQAAFADKPTFGDELTQLLKDKRLGEAILVAIDKVAQGADGDLRGLTEGLALLREVGLEQVARQAALEVLLLDRQG